MARKFIVERGTKVTNDQQSNHVRRSNEIRYTITEAIKIFIGAKEAEGIRARTIKGYLDTVRYFREWLPNDIKYFDEIDAKIIREYINYLRTERLPYQGDSKREKSTKGLSVYTINIRLRNLRTIFRFLYLEGLIKANPTSNIPLVKDDAHEEVQGLSDKEIDAILASYEDKLFAQWRDKTLALLLLDTGLRINEALSLTADQIDFKELTLLIPSQVAKTESIVKFQ